MACSAGGFSIKFAASKDTTSTMSTAWAAALLVVFSCAATITVQGKAIENHLDICSGVVCRPGRTCQILDNGLPSCQCVHHCPATTKPVCGSNGVSYENHCLLHRDACLRQVHISIKHKGLCKRSKVRPPHHKHSQKPVVCLQHERDRLRRKFVELLEDKVTSGRHYTSVVASTFRNCDRDADDVLDTHELLSCIRRNHTAFHTWLGHRGESVGTLCIDAMVEVADRNSDWVLTMKEFQAFMAPNYRAPVKECHLDGKRYKDGEEIVILCSICVCTGGDWTCAGNICETKAHKKEKKGHHHHGKNENSIPHQRWEQLLKDLNS